MSEQVNSTTAVGQLCRRAWCHVEEHHADYGVALFVLPVLGVGLVATMLATTLAQWLG